ncbi:nuclear protein localization protein 4 homolog isoform X2 [Solea solea]|uniref:nuclear protein localization protein 4 homolog isoform X2 n=1 Tax=Solea solea TaxID=90069 RepID=UPI00272CA3D7|nr:nuclear protein localization protein 4 homolog isoform X2 [Solea solea]
MADNIIVRVQSPDGMRKIPSTKRETAAAFLKKVAKEFGFNTNGFSVYLNRDKTGEILSQNKALSLLKIKHGDMLYLVPSGASTSSSGEVMDTALPHTSSSSSSLPSVSSSSSLMSRSSSAPQVQEEDEIDQYLTKQDGKIYRNRDPQLCRHGALGKCVHCVPLEPFDEDYLNHLDPPVKHMSFHAYLRKLTGGSDKGKFAALENISCKIKSGCDVHPPWPEGICTKCQPSAIILNRQKYRHVDNIMFENNTIANSFLDFWRKTGSQRVGLLYGKYTEHTDIPLGIRAEVAAIYEPPQTATQNSLELLEDPKAAAVDEIAAKLGLCKVGWIFTDLLSEDTRIGTVRYTRNKDSHYLSSEECIMAGYFQNQHSNPCRLSRDGFFGSKFVTVVASGEEVHHFRSESGGEEVHHFRSESGGEEVYHFISESGGGEEVHHFRSESGGEEVYHFISESGGGEEVHHFRSESGGEEVYHFISESGGGDKEVLYFISESRGGEEVHHFRSESGGEEVYHFISESGGGDKEVLYFISESRGGEEVHHFRSESGGEEVYHFISESGGGDKEVLYFISESEGGSHVNVCYENIFFKEF